MPATKRPRVLVPLARGAEEMETVIIVDVLRRGGVEVVLAGLEGPDPVPCSRGVSLVPDMALCEARGPFDVIALPGGGEGSERLAESEEIGRLLREQENQGRTIAAICAAPQAVVAHGVGAGKQITSHPAVAETVSAHGTYREAAVVEDGELVTSRGPGTAFQFALALVARLVGQERADSLRGPMMLD